MRLAATSFALLALSLLALSIPALSLPSPAAADAIGPEEPLSCPRGSQAETNHCGTICVAPPCTTDADCESGERCAVVPFCVEQLTCGGWGGQVTSVTGSCEGGCAEGACGEVRTCFDADGVNPDGTVPPENVTYGCGCRVGGAPARGGVAALAIALALIAARRRRRS